MEINYNKMFDKDQEKPIQTIDEESLKTDIKVEPSQTPLKSVEYRIVNCTRLNFREEPNTNSNVLSILKEEDTILVKSIKDGWAYAFKTSGIECEGYVMVEYIKEV